MCWDMNTLLCKTLEHITRACILWIRKLALSANQDTHNLLAKMADYIQHKEVHVQQVYTVLVWSKNGLERIGLRGKGGMTSSENNENQL